MQDLHRDLPNSSTGLLSIGKAAKLLGVSIITIRRWEIGGKIKIVRSPGGTRLVPSEEIDRLKSTVQQGAVVSKQGPETQTDQTLVSEDTQEYNQPTHEEITQQSPTIKIHQKVLHHIKYTRPDWYRNYHNSRLSEVVHYSLLGVYLVLAGSFILYSLFIGPNLNKTDDLGKQLADLGDVLAATSPPSVLSFQGRLTDENSVPVSSSTKFVFRIYDAETGGTLKWTSKDWTLTPDQNGIFSVCLGNQTTTDDCLVNGTADTLFPTDLFTDNAALYLEIDVHNPPADPAETLSPRQRISSVSYALNAGAVDGVDSLSFLRSDASDTFDAGNTLTIAGTLTDNGVFTLGDNGDTGAVNTSDWDISTTGAMTFIDSIANTSADLALLTTTSGNITLTPAATTGLVNVLTGSLKVGNGTPAVTLNGEDAYIEGTFEVDGASTFDGSITANTDVDFNLNSTENLTITQGVGSMVADLALLYFDLTGDWLTASSNQQALRFDINAIGLAETDDSIIKINFESTSIDAKTYRAAIDIYASRDGGMGTNTVTDAILIRT